MQNTIIREIRKEDDGAVANVIRSVLIEYNVPKVGTAYADASLDCMHATFGVPDWIKLRNRLYALV